MKGITFCPAHITGFFKICEAKIPEKKGSKGAGICLSKGVLTTVEAKKSKNLEIEIYLNEKKSNAPVTKTCIRKLVGNLPYKIIVKSEIQLPISQGFGISGAGALSAGVAVSKALNLNLTFYDIVKTAHSSEIKNKTGLGDVVAQATGGITIRKKPGIPPYGFVDKIIGNNKIVICVIGEKLETSKILENPKYRKPISKYGSICLKKLLKKPTIENLFDLSYEFSKKTNFVSKEVFEAIESCRKFGKASVSMIGNSVFAMGKTEKLEEVLKNFGKVYISEIDNCGARILE